MKNSFDLKYFREKNLKMTQAELAKLLGVRQDFISRLEKNPADISLDFLLKLAEMTGMTVDQILNFEKNIPEGINPKNNWEDIALLKNAISKIISGTNISENGIYGLKEKHIELQEQIAKLCRKPRIVFLGRSDAGKSTLINSLIGVEKMPTNWTPTTSIVVYIKHISDRPQFITEDCWIFKKGADDSDWDVNKLNDEKYCKDWKVSSGEASILSSYGTRNGNKYSEEEIGSAVVFVDSPALKNCDFLDVPGLTGGYESDNKAARRAREFADVIVYMSQSNSFMSTEDIEYIKQALNVLPVIEKKGKNDFEPLGNLFIIASQAHIIDSKNRKESLEMILDDGTEKLFRTIAEDLWDIKKSESQYDYNAAVLRKRFFTYTTNNSELRKNFEKEFVKMVEHLPLIALNNIKNNLSSYCSERSTELDKIIESIEKLISDRKFMKEELDRLLDNEPRREIESLRAQNRVLIKIRDAQDKCLNKFQEKYESILNEDYIVNVIEEKGFKNKKDDIKMLASYINSKVNGKFNKILKTYSEDISQNINDYLDDFEASCKCNINHSFSYDFNTKAAFASGLSGLATLGGLSFWAASLGNLGGYILVAKGVSVLATLGIGVGGTAAAISTVAALGGPVVLGIASAALVTLSLLGLSSINWKKRVAKKIIESYKEQNVKQKYNDAIRSYWKDTETAFLKGSEEVEKRWKENLKNRQKQIDETDDKALKDSRYKVYELKYVIDSIIKLLDK